MMKGVFYKKGYVILGLLLCSVILLVFYKDRDNIAGLWDSIEKKGEIVFLTEESFPGFYTYKGKFKGFEYELAKEFADFYSLRLKVKTEPSPQELVEAIDKREGDFAGSTLMPDTTLRKRYLVSDSYLKTEPIWVISKSKEMGGTISQVYVREGSPFVNDKNINIDKIKWRCLKASSEELMEAVSMGFIPSTMLPGHLARLYIRYYPDLKLKTVAPERDVCWLIPRNAKKLLKKVNYFLKEFKKSGVLDRLYRKYFSNLEYYNLPEIEEFRRKIDKKLPEYLPIIHQATSVYGLDWRLVAAVIFQESRFDPWARSAFGAVGLMQVMEKTAMELNFKRIEDPAVNIWAGCKYLQLMFRRFRDIPEGDRIFFALAAYNVGPGHVRDAMELAAKLGLDPKSWDNIKIILPQLRYKVVYTHTRHGFCRGEETVGFVTKVMMYYDLLKRNDVLLYTKTKTESFPAS